MTNTATLQVTAPTEQEIVMSRDFDAPRALVFDALTKPELVQRWLLGPPGWTMPVCEIDLKVGGAYRYVWRNDADGTEFGLGGVYREIAAPERLVARERSKGIPARRSTRRFSSSRTAGQRSCSTMLFESQEARDAALKSGMESGVAASYDRLEELLAPSA